MSNLNLLASNEEDSGPYKKNSLKHVLNILSSTVSTLYALILIASFTALTSARIVSFPAKNHQIQVHTFLASLLAISVTFLLYIFIYLTKSRSSSSRIWLHHRSHGSAFLRQGAIVFGLGTLAYALLEFMATFQVFPGSHCNDRLRSLVFLFYFIFIILQSLVIVMYPRLNISKFPLVAKFGMIHLVATNIVMWIECVVKESMHQLVEAEEMELERLHHNHGEKDSRMVDFLKKLVSDHHGECRNNQHFNNFLGDALIKASPYLFAFIIEFSLIGATVFYTTWCHVGVPPSDQQTSKSMEKPNPKHFISKSDWSHSLSGFLVGIFINIVNFFNIGVFFVNISREDVGNEFIIDIINTLLNILGTIACISGLIKIQQLDHKKEEKESGLDLTMLNISGFFMYFYACLTAVVGFNTTEVEEGNNVLMVMNGLVEMLCVTLQISFLTNLLQKMSKDRDVCSKSCQSLYDGCKPGRQEVMFLVLLNISQWFRATLELQKSMASPWERSFYGFLPWVILQRISLPLCIFFRFHSAVIAVDCWKNAYKQTSNNAQIEVFST